MAALIAAIETIGEMSLDLSLGDEFGRNGHAPQADGSWLRYSVRMKNQKGRKSKSKGKGKRASKVAQRQKRSIVKMFGNFAIHDVEDDGEDDHDVVV